MLHRVVASLLALALADGVRAAESPLWLTYAGGEGPGKGKHIVLIAGDQEYRSECALPMLARICPSGTASSARFCSV